MAGIAAAMARDRHEHEIDMAAIAALNQRMQRIISHTLRDYIIADGF